MSTKMDLLHAQDTMNDAYELLSKGGVLVITIKSTSKSNLSFKFDVRLYWTDDKLKVQSYYLNWAYAQVMGMKQNEKGEVKGSGIGIDRAFEVANNFEHIFKTLDLDPIKVRYEGVY